MLETLKTNRAQAFLFSLVLGVFLFSSLAFIPNSLENLGNDDGIVLIFFSAAPFWFQIAFSFLAYLVTIWYANYIAVKHQLLGRGNQLVGFFVVILLATGPALLFQNLISLSSLLIVRFFDRCFEIQKSANPNPLLFDASFLVSVLSLIYTPFILLLPISLAAALYATKFNIKGWLLSVFTVFVVFYLFAGALYLFNQAIISSVTLPRLEVKLSDSINAQILFYSILVFVAIALPSTIKVARHSKVILRNHLNLVMWSIPILGLIFLFSNLKREEVFAFLFFPLAIIFGQFFLKIKKKKLANALFILVLILFVTYQLFRMF